MPLEKIMGLVCIVLGMTATAVDVFDLWQPSTPMSTAERMSLMVAGWALYRTA